jgi:hypothetical protein
VGGEVVRKGEFIVAKRDVDYERWNRLTEGRAVPVEGSDR